MRAIRSLLAGFWLAYAEACVPPPWFSAVPSPQAPGWALFVQLEDLLDRLHRAQLDGDRSAAVGTKKGKLSRLDVVLRHRTECSSGLGTDRRRLDHRPVVPVDGMKCLTSTSPKFTCNKSTGWTLASMSFS